MSQMFGTPLTLTSAGRQGYTIVRQGSQLVRLRYFDGKFLRAADLELEQRYTQTLIQLSNQAGGPGIVHGFSTVLGDGDTLLVGEGLGIDTQGRVLLLQTATPVPIRDLLGAPTLPPGPVPYGDDVILQPRPRPEPPALFDPPRVFDSPGPMTIAMPGISRPQPEVGRLQPEIRAFASAPAMRSASGWVLSDPAARPAREGEFGDCEPHIDDGPDRIVALSDLYLIVVAHAEELCGHEDVYGRLCEAACTTRSERPYVVEGIVVRAIPLGLNVSLGQFGPVVLSQRHLRSRVASEYYAREATLIGSLISKEGLASEAWCLGAEALGGHGVPIGVLARAGNITTFFDAWIGRRERMEAPPRHYWAWRMAMRPWNVYLAQVLQFQCHLHELFQQTPGTGGTDPCGEDRALIDQASGALTTLKDYYEKVSGALARLRLPETDDIVKMDDIKERVGNYASLLGKLEDARRGVSVGTRVLVRGGIVELPSAGYLPVARTAEMSVNQQVRNLLGEGVDLRFCVVRPDFVPHALEEAQHMDRISLVQGLANAADRPRVDILVPNGELVDEVVKADGMAFSGRVQFVTAFAIDGASGSLSVTGAGRGEVLAAGGAAFHFAGVGQAPPPSEFGLFVRGFDNLNEVRDRGSFGAIERAAPTVPEGVFRIRDAAHRISVNRVMSFSDGVVRGTPEGLPGSAIEQPTANKLGAVWATIRSDQNPFALQVGQETPLDGRIIVAVPTAKVSMADITLRGALRVGDVTPSYTLTDRCRGFATLDVVWTGYLAGNQQVKHDRLDALVELERTDRSGGSTVVVKLTLSPKATEAAAARLPVTLTFETSWSGTPVSATSNGRLAFGEKAESVFESSLRENADVLNAGNAEHDLAVTALEVIDAVLAEPAFKAHAEQLLFPPARPTSREQTLRPTLDWVLFHRRRDKACGGKDAVVEVKNRRYRAYAGFVKTAEQAKEVLEALRKNQGAAAFRRAQFGPAGTVEFAGGTANLLTGAAALASQWQNVPHGNRIILGAIANQGEAVSDGQPLSLARLKQFEVALEPLGMRIDPAAVSELLPAVPAPTLPADDTDGIIAVVTYPFVDLRRARAVLYRPAGTDAVRRITNRPILTAVVPLPDVVLTFEGNVIVDNDETQLLAKILQELTAEAGVGALRMEIAPATAPDAQTQARANSLAELLRRQPVNNAAGQPYLVLDQRAVVGTRKLRDANPDERDILKEADKEVDEIVAFIIGD